MRLSLGRLSLVDWKITGGELLPPEIADQAIMHLIADGQGVPSTLLGSMTSEEGYTFSSSGAARGTYEESGGPGGRGYVSMAAGDGYGSVDASLLTLLDGDPAVVVAGIIRGDSGGALGAYSGWTDTTGAAVTELQRHIIRTSDQKTIWRRDGDIGTLRQVASAGGDYTADTWFAIVDRYEPGPATWEAWTYIDGSQVANGTFPDAGDVTVAQVMAGCGHLDTTIPAGADSLRGDFAEIIIFSGTFTADQLSALHTYLAGRL